MRYLPDRSLQVRTPPESPAVPRRDAPNCANEELAERVTSIQTTAGNNFRSHVKSRMNPSHLVAKYNAAADGAPRSLQINLRLGVRQEFRSASAVARPVVPPRQRTYTTLG